MCGKGRELCLIRDGRELDFQCAFFCKACPRPLFETLKNIDHLGRLNYGLTSKDSKGRSHIQRSSCIALLIFGPSSASKQQQSDRVKLPCLLSLIRVQ